MLCKEHGEQTRCLLPSAEKGTVTAWHDVPPMDCCTRDAHEDAPLLRQQQGIARQCLCPPKNTQPEEMGTALRARQSSRASALSGQERGLFLNPKPSHLRRRQDFLVHWLQVHSHPLAHPSMLIPRILTKRGKQDPTHFYSSGAGRRTPSIRVPPVRSLWKRQKGVRLAIPPRTILLPSGKGWEHFSRAAPLMRDSARREAAALGRK